MNMNPMALQMLNMIKNGANPQQMVLSVLKQNANGNPVLENLISLAESNNGPEIERVARNIVASKGGDYNKEFNNFKQTLGL